VTNTDSDLDARTLLTGQGAYEITGLHTYNRDPSPPIAVSAGSAMVANLDAEFLGGSTKAQILAAAAAAASASIAWPIGSVFIGMVSTNPQTLLAFTSTWVALGAGRVLVGFDSGQVEFDAVRETGGAKTVTLDETMIPSHTHTQDAHTHTQNAHTHTYESYNGNANAAGANSLASKGDGALNSTVSSTSVVAVNQNATATNQNTGGGLAHSNLQPYLVVYFWERTA
jgi:microcystin-dependent protein